MKSALLIFCPLLLLATTAYAEERQFTLVASATRWQIAAGQTVSAYTYNGTIPGPELRVNAGDTLRVTLVNNLPAATTIHWHGVPVPNNMDGVPGLTSPIITPSQSFTYVFPAPATGT